MQHLYRATFTGGDVREQVYARKLTHAWKATYTCNGATATKYGFSGSYAKAEKATIFPKRCKVEKIEIVEATEHDAPAKATASKPKKVKPFAKGETVTVNHIGGCNVFAKVKGMRGGFVTLTIDGIMNDVRVKLASVQKINPDPTPLAQAA